MKVFLATLVISFLLNACGQQGSSNDNTATAADPATIDVNRANPKTAPVQVYEEKVANDLNNWFFKVKLYETGKRFTYRITLEYEEVTGEDEINFPNLGMDPKPLIKKGAEKYECIVGFLDQKGEFREYKKVHVVGGNLKITTLKSYAVRPGA